jgi:mannose-1-phosphate guanylyltransferase/mannose-6-phosphate isomerase
VIIPVILAGGSGTRLWPLSRELQPKQLLALTDNHTMLQNTLLRLAGMTETARPMVICNETYGAMVDSQLRDIDMPASSIFLEPVGRNTAPAVAVAALKAAANNLEALILVLPADHLIQNISAFHAALALGMGFAQQGGLVTFGIVPDRPETGYGYIRKGQSVQIHKSQGPDDAIFGFSIAEFVEKPDLQTARQYVSSGDYCWNSGMFMFPVSGVLTELRRFVPDIVGACERAMAEGRAESDFFYLDHDAFAACPSDSIDYAVMEKTSHGVMIPLNAGWDDVGSWEALWKVGKKDAFGNVISGDVICVDTKNSFVRSESRLVTVLGVQDLAIVETPDAILVSALSNTQGVKQIVDRLKSEQRPETRTHRQSIRSWGLKSDE